ncbi:Hsp20/alpha crystallin family protein [Anaerosalibacter bizertensis]|uniref:Hsp20/alpha crystallin family protein n=1 Tax=Anaerosalibacter bizertensis TaxID=932217 RepID=UPI001C0EE1F9|nr:Hsp20/alpha crystallin family protein [Anaerosalibacter bizertensis]MBU5294367.1 Hsp20/alpha crystallin family protein [Anaerosalibacter bizertensis]
MFGLTPYRRGISRRRDFNTMDQMFNSMVEEFFNGVDFPSFVPMDNESIRVDIKENDEEYILEAEIPGVDKKDIKLELKDDLLTISVERDEEIKEEKENYIRREIKRGRFQRGFYVDNIKEDEIKAKFKDGILYITLPKDESEKSKGNQIKIE